MNTAGFADRKSGVWLALLMPLCFLSLAATGVAHDRLVRSSPATGDTLHAVPERLSLTFSRHVQLTGAEVRLIGPDGAVQLAPLEIAGTDSATIVAAIASRLVAGSHTVEWQILGTDGHPVRGAFHFLIDANAAGLEPAPAPDPQPQAPPPPPVEKRSDFDVQSPLYVLVRWISFLTLVGVIGATAFRLLVLPRARLAAPGVASTAATLAARIGHISAALCLVAGVARLAAQTAAVQNASATALITDTTWGTGWLLQMIAAAVAFAGFLFAGRGGSWIVAAVATLALALYPALSGHAAGHPAMAAGHWLHVLAAGGWIGSLLVLVAAGMPAARAAGESRATVVRALVNAFSPAALVFAAILVVTGVAAAWIHLGGLSELLASDYGRALMFKLGAIVLVLAFGGYNFLRVKPSLDNDGSVAALRRSARAELTFAALVLLITAVLVATPPPAEAPSPPVATAPGANAAN